MLSKLIVTGIGIAAAATILAPTAAADSPDMTSGNKVSPGTVVNADDVPYPYPYSNGFAHPFVTWNEDCKPVRGRWTSEGFVRDSGGRDVAWTNGDGHLYSSPFDDGLSDSSRDMLNRINKKKVASAAE